MILEADLFKAEVVVEIEIIFTNKVQPVNGIFCKFLKKAAGIFQKGGGDILKGGGDISCPEN